MVVRLVLEEEQPVLLFAVHRNFDLDGAGIDLLRFVQLLQHAALFQKFCGNGADVHEVDGLCSADLLTGGEIVLIRLLQKRILEGDGVNGCEECGMAAVIGPIGIDHSDLGERRIAPFPLEICLTERHVVGVHGEVILLHEVRKPFLVKLQKSRQRGDFGRNRMRNFQRCGNGERCLSALHGVDDILFDRLEFILGEYAVDGIHLCRADDGARLHGDELNALRRRVCALIELPGKILHGKHARARKIDALARSVHLRLGEDGVHALRKELLLDILCIVAVENTDARDAGDAQKFPDV